MTGAFPVKCVQLVPLCYSDPPALPAARRRSAAGLPCQPRRLGLKLLCAETRPTVQTLVSTVPIAGAAR